MSQIKKQKIEMYLQKIAWYSIYVDCLSRLIHELIENGDDNLKPTDLPNLSVLLEKLAYRLRMIVANMSAELEFAD